MTEGGSADQHLIEQYPLSELITKDHQSTALSCPLFNSTSGARYSGVPHKVFVNWPSELLSYILRSPWPTRNRPILCDRLFREGYSPVWGPCRWFCFRGDTRSPRWSRKGRILPFFQWNGSIFEDGEITRLLTYLDIITWIPWPGTT